MNCFFQNQIIFFETLSEIWPLKFYAPNCGFNFRYLFPTKLEEKIICFDIFVEAIFALWIFASIWTLNGGVIVNKMLIWNESVCFVWDLVLSGRLCYILRSHYFLQNPKKPVDILIFSLIFFWVGFHFENRFSGCL